MDTARQLAADIVEERRAGEAIRFIVGCLGRCQTPLEAGRGLLLIAAILWRCVTTA